jgi:hypothetical protein
MKQRWCVSLVVTCLVCLIGWTGYGQGQKSNASRQAWEYKEVVVKSTDELNMLGAQGWELVTVTVMNNNTYWYYLKRPK